MVFMNCLLSVDKKYELKKVGKARIKMIEMLKL